MKTIPIYQADAFTDHLFGGNPAAVCPLESWLPDETMQQVAMENNLAETAFFVPEGDHFRIRWFTPETEVDLCGHATLATSHVLFALLGFPGEVITFESRSGPLRVTRTAGMYQLDFPADEFHRVAPPKGLTEAMNMEPEECYRGRTDYMAVYGSEDLISSLDPGITALSKIEGRGIIITAPGHSVDFVSRFFAPQSGVPEDPVTGSAHTTLVPYWAERLHKTDLTAMQLSRRKGILFCTLAGDRVLIRGNAVTYLKGEITLD
jgi:PhzF family phenazine biosynthesis protein